MRPLVHSPEQWDGGQGGQGDKGERENVEAHGVGSRGYNPDRAFPGTRT